MEKVVDDLLECDLILKGGITSGVVYPGVAVELARKYRFRSIGGTSAGAIAAAAIAAAEVGRQSGRGGFEALEGLPAWLAEEHEGKTNLLNLFRPNAGAERLHGVLMSGLGKDKPFWRMLLGLLRRYVAAFFVGSLLGLVFLFVALLWAEGLVAFTGFLSALVVALFGGVGVAFWRFYLTSSKAIEGNYLGLTTGHDASGSELKPMLTDWLCAYLDELAGFDDRDAPLTFGDLKACGVDLLVITTCVTHGRPYQLPFDSKIFFMHKRDLRMFFPRKVVAWLEAKHAASKGRLGSEFIQLPDADDLPVVFATRLSLSFPVLISALPLYAIDKTRRHDEDQVMERCWFTDGGVSSNFPVHLFDSALPTRPTFAVNLKPHHPDYGPNSWDFAARQGVWMPERNQAGQSNRWTRFDDAHGFLSLFSFVKTVVEAGFNWQDSLLAAAPGQRDRIVQVGLAPEEGGLNLAMDKSTIMALYERGQLAGRLLVSRFALREHHMNWENHKWIRYRSFMAALERVLSNYHAAFDAELDLGEDYKVLLDQPQSRAPSYPLKPKAKQRLAKQVTKELLALSELWVNDAETLIENSPSPKPKLRMTVEP